MKILIVSDAWLPQVNGVVRSLDTVRGYAESRGHPVEVIGPAQFRTLPCPTYPEIRLAVGVRRRMAGMIRAYDPDAIHLATEGPLGWAARRYCLHHSLTFTTSFHTLFPDYVRLRFGVPRRWTFAVLRRFHRPAACVMVATPTLERRLRDYGFARMARWSRGVDTALFRPRDKGFLTDPRPIQLYVGRVAVEKNIEAFLALDTPGTKYVVGDGPQLADLRRRYPAVRFPGAKHGEELAAYYAAADVFVFPSRTDTFGLVLLEALASGVPVAAYPVPGPIDVVDGAPVGCLDDDLGRAVRQALEISSEACRAFALQRSWSASNEQFMGNLHPFR